MAASRGFSSGTGLSARFAANGSAVARAEAGLEQRVAELEARVADLVQQVHRLADRRRARDAVHVAALEALARATRGLVFSAQSAIAVAQTVDADLEAALRAAALETPPALGRWLALVARRPLAGFRVQRVKRELVGVLWVVRAA